MRRTHIISCIVGMSVIALFFCITRSRPRPTYTPSLLREIYGAVAIDYPIQNGGRYPVEMAAASQFLHTQQAIELSSRVTLNRLLCGRSISTLTDEEEAKTPLLIFDDSDSASERLVIFANGVPRRLTRRELQQAVADHRLSLKATD